MSVRRDIHLVNPLWNAAGGSEMHTLELFRELSPHADVRLWSEVTPDPDLAAAWPIQRIDLERGNFPRGGTLVFVGFYHFPGPWIAQAQPRRAIVHYNIRAVQALIRFMRRLFAQKIERVEVVFASLTMQQETKLRGIVEPSLIDLVRFRPRSVVEESGTHQRPFVVGRLPRADHGRLVPGQATAATSQC
jgi:hypothetical protein